MNRSTLLLVIVLIALGGIVFFLLPGEKEHETSYAPGDLKIAIDSASVIKLELRKPGKTLTIENVGGRWTITSPLHAPADPSTVTQLLSGLAKFTVGSLISSNPERQGIFQVDSTGTRLTVTERSGKSTSMIIGKMGPSFSEVYFRLPDAKDVYLGQGFDAWSISREAKDWRDKTILSLPTEGIASLNYQTAGRQYAYLRDSSGWKLDAKPVDRSLIAGTLNSLATLKADEILDSTVAPATRPVTVQIAGAENATLQFFPAATDSSKYYVQVQGNPATYVLSKWTAQEILKPAGGESMLSSQPLAAAKPAPKPPPITKAPPASASPGKVAQAPISKNIATSSPPPKKEVAKPTAAPRTEPKSQAAAETKPTTTRPIVKKERPIKLAQPRTRDTEIPQARTADKGAQQQEETPTKGTESAPAKGNDAAPTKQVEKAPAKSVEPAPVTKTAPTKTETAAPSTSSSSADDEGDLMVYTVQKGETMTTIAKKYSVTVEQILKWNLLRSISVKPGQELYIYQRKK